MGKEYQPGVTELRMNVKAALHAVQELSKEHHKTNAIIQELKESIITLVQEKNTLSTEVNNLKAKLYENGIR